MKNTPGPRAPPERRRPSRKITVRSYSLKTKIFERSKIVTRQTWTTLITMRREKGRVTTMRIKEKSVRRWAQMPGASSHTYTEFLCFVSNGLHSGLPCESFRLWLLLFSIATVLVLPFMIVQVFLNLSCEQIAFDISALWAVLIYPWREGIEKTSMGMQ